MGTEFGGKLNCVYEGLITSYDRIYNKNCAKNFLVDLTTAPDPRTLLTLS